MDPKKRFPALSILILAWSGFVIAAYFVVQKPLALQVLNGLMRTAWTLIVTSVLVLNAVALGIFTIRRMINNISGSPSSLALAGGIGLGELGLLGFFFAAAGASHFWMLLTAQILLLSWLTWKGFIREALSSIENVAMEIKSSAQTTPSWMKWAALIALILTLLMMLLPPADAFDALFYHLTMPERWLRDGGLVAYNFPHYWFPGIVEGTYFWGLGLGSEISPQQLHFAWGLFTVILVWDWTRGLWGNLAAWWALTLMISVPSLLLLASWPYTDLALTFYGVAMLYTLSVGKAKGDTRWWNLSAISAGMAMGVKYTSFVMPLTAALLIFRWEFSNKRKLLIGLLRFAVISAIVALVWYLRNWIWMGNPSYPFAFGGRYWDSFRADWFATPGTGSGWDLKALILLPLTVTLGYQDINVIDADIGPLLLLALPLALWMFNRIKDIHPAQRITLTSIALFTLFSAAIWMYGYITTRDLWQTRLLLPALVAWVIPSAVGLTSLSSLDTRRLRLYFIVSSLAAISIFINLIDMGLTVVARNPLSIAAGITTSQQYFERYQPGYAGALELVSQTPPGSKIYSLFEPRSYGMSRSVQPDPILDNFSHDVYLYGNPQTIITRWRSEGFTHVLLNKRSVSAILESAEDELIFNETLKRLKPLSTTADGSYELLEVPRE